MSTKARPDTPPRGGRGSGGSATLEKKSPGWLSVQTKLETNLEDREKGPSLIEKAKDKRAAAAWDKHKNNGPRWLGSISDSGEASGAGEAVPNAEHRAVLSEDGSYVRTPVENTAQYTARLTRRYNCAAPSFGGVNSTYWSFCIHIPPSSVPISFEAR